MNTSNDSILSWDDAVIDTGVSSFDALEAGECISLEEAGLEPTDIWSRLGEHSVYGNVPTIVSDWSDGEDSRYETN